jgi:hypothetical protein
MRLIKIIDSTAHFDGSYTADNTFFFYDSLDRLTKSQKYQEKFPESPNYETLYYYDPYRSTTIQRRDSLIVYHKTKEYENDFYVKRFYGYYLESKLKNSFRVEVQDTIKYQFSDPKDLQKFNDDSVFSNRFNSSGQIINSDINTVFMNDRIVKHKLTYYYHPNGLLKSVRGYIPEFFEYEFYK